MNGNGISPGAAEKPEGIGARVLAVRAMLDIIHDRVTENPVSDALYGTLFALDEIERDLFALREGATV